MKKLISIGIVGFVLVGFAIAYAIHQTMPAETMVPLPGPVGSAVYKYITIEEPYKDWDIWPGTGRLSKGRPPLEYITTYVNDNALFSIKVGEKMANGSIIVTENYTPEKMFSALFVMYKIKGYNPQGGDWFWAQYDARGKAVKVGKVKGCISCHTEVKENDYVFTEKFVK